MRFNPNNWFEVYTLHRAVMGSFEDPIDRLVIVRSEEELTELEDFMTEASDGEVLYSAGLLYAARGPDEVKQLIDLLTGALIDDVGPVEPDPVYNLLESEISKARAGCNCNERVIVDEDGLTVCGPKCATCLYYASIDERCEIRELITQALNEDTARRELEGPDYDDPIYQG